MSNYDYVVLIDEHGQPYIAHSFKSRVSSGWGKVKGAGKRAYGAARTAGSKAHKYMLKIGEGAKAKYAYTKEEVDALLGRGRRAAKNAGSKIKDVADSAARSVSKGYRARSDWKEADARVKQADADYRAAGNKRARLWRDADAAIKARDAHPNSAYGQKHADDAIAAMRNELDADEVSLALKKREDESAKALKLLQEYSKTPLSKVEAFMKDPLTHTKWAIEDVIDDVQTKVEDIQDKIAERRTARREAKAEKAMQNDSIIRRNRDEFNTSKSILDNAAERFFEYTRSPNAERGSAKWKRLEREYNNAKDYFDFASMELWRQENKARRSYGLSTYEYDKWLTTKPSNNLSVREIDTIPIH